MNIEEALINAQEQFKKNKISSAGLDAEILLLKVINGERRTKNKKQKIEIDKTWFYAHPEYKLSKTQQKNFESFIKRRIKKEPIAYIISRKEFFNLDFYVDKRVMIPRPETEIIIEKIIRNNIEVKLQQNLLKFNFNIIDIGTGSGCISIALAKNIDNVKIYAIDISKKAIEIAKINARKNKVFSRIKFLNIGVQNFEFLQNKIDKEHPTIIIANLPYLRTKDIKKNIGLTYEPIISLNGGKDGLEKIKEFIIQLKKINFDIFECWIEINPEQTDDLIYFIKKKLGGVKIKILKDLFGQNRFLKIHNDLI